MVNLREWLEQAETKYGEHIESMVVGQHYRDRWGSGPALPDENVLLDRDAGLAKVDQEYDNGYGCADCFPLYAWTASRVFFVSEYDGSTGLSYIPRNPTACEPRFDGDPL